MVHADSLAAEIEQLEKKTYGKPDKSAPEALEPEKEVSERKPEEAPVAKAADQPTEPKPEAAEPDSSVAEPKEEIDWEKRFKNFKSTADATINGLRRENLALREGDVEKAAKIQDLAQKFAAMQNSAVDPFKDLFTEDERELIGEETLSALKKANEAMVQARVKPLEDSLKKEQEERTKREKQRLENEKAQNDREFISKLQKIVPNCLVIDKNPEFLQWMKMADEYSGQSRERIFMNARMVGDVRRAAEFFQEFEELKKPKANPELDKRVTPTSTGTPNTQRPPKKQQGVVLNQRVIEGFYDDVVKGKYRNRPKERQAMEEKIDAHLRRTGMGR